MRAFQNRGVIAGRQRRDDYRLARIARRETIRKLAGISLLPVIIYDNAATWLVQLEQRIGDRAGDTKVGERRPDPANHDFLGRSGRARYDKSGDQDVVAALDRETRRDVERLPCTGVGLRRIDRSR